MVNGNGKIPISLKAMFWGIGLIFAFGITYATVKFGIARLDKIEPMVYEHDKKIGVIETDIKYIRSGIDEIKKKL